MNLPSSRGVFLPFLLSASLAAQSICWQENAGPTFNNGTFIGPGNGITAVRLELPFSLNISGVEVFTGEAPGTGAVSVWSDDAANQQPLARLAQQSFTVQAANGFQGTDFTAPMAFAAGQVIWIGWSLPFTSQSPIDVTKQVPGQFYRTSLNSGESWFGPFQFPANHFKFRLRGPCGTCAGYTTAYGPGCGNPNTPPRLSGGGCPAENHQVLLRVEDAAASQPAILLFGTTTVTVPVAGCTVLVAPVLSLGFALDANGAFDLVLPLPAGVPPVDLFAQAMFSDPAQPALLGGTNGLQMSVR